MNANYGKKKKAKKDPMADMDYAMGGDDVAPSQPKDESQMDPGMDQGMGGPAEPPVAPADTMMQPQSQFVSTDPAQMMGAIQQLMRSDHDMLAQQQMAATAGLGQMMIQAVQQAQGMAQSIDSPGGMMTRG